MAPDQTSAQAESFRSTRAAPCTTENDTLRLDPSRKLALPAGLGLKGDVDLSSEAGRRGSFAAFIRLIGVNSPAPPSRHLAQFCHKSCVTRLIGFSCATIPPLCKYVINLVSRDVLKLTVPCHHPAALCNSVINPVSPD